MKISILLASVLISASLQAEPLIENAYIQIEQVDKTLVLTSQLDAQKMSIQLKLPGSLETIEKSISNDATWGGGQRLTLQHGDRTTTLTLYGGNPFAHLETHVTNPSKDVHDMKKLTIVDLTLNLETDPDELRMLGTGGLQAMDRLGGSYAYSALADPQSRNGIVCGWLTQRRAAGLMLPSFEADTCNLEVQLDFGIFRIKPGETRETDILQLGFFKDARKGLEHYADDIATVYSIKLPPKPGVYCTWYHRDARGSGSSTEKAIAENAAFAREQLQPFGLSVMQMDDHWQERSISSTETGESEGKGPVKTFRHVTKNFPKGMPATADTLRKEGFVPGLWYMPFSGNIHNSYFDRDLFYKVAKTGEPFTAEKWSGAGIDPTSPKGEAFLRERFKRIQDWGYRYIKVDGLHTGTPSENIYRNSFYRGVTFAEAENYDPSMTFIEGYRKGLGILREETPGTFILGCTATQNMLSFAPVFGMVDAMRVGPDNDSGHRGAWNGVTNGAKFAGNLWFLNGRVWYNDPDPIYVRKSNPLNKARWMASWLAVSGAMNTTSMQYSELDPARLDMIKRTLPAHDFNARPIDILENKNPSIWKVENERVSVVGLFNWNETEKTKVEHTFERMGLDPEKSYEAFDFWENRYLGTIQNSVSKTLEAASCQMLVLRESKSYPQLLSTSRHITQGLMDVVSEEWNATGKELGGTSKGVANDPYEMRIVCPDGFRAIDIQVNDKKAKLSSLEQADGLVRVSITPSVTGSMDWTVSFQ